MTPGACFRGENGSENLVFGVDNNTIETISRHHGVMTMARYQPLTQNKHAAGLEAGHIVGDGLPPLLEEVVANVIAKTGGTPVIQQANQIVVVREIVRRQLLQDSP